MTLSSPKEEESPLAEKKPLVAQMRQKRSEMMASELEDIALQMFEERGFANVTVDDVAAEAGLSVRTFYRYFPTKDDVLQVRSRRAAEALRAALAERPDDEPPLASLREACAAVAGADDAEYGRRWNRVVANAPSVLASVIGGIQLATQEVMREFFAARLDLPKDSVTAVMLAAAAGGVLQAAEAQWFFNGGDLATVISDGLGVLEEWFSTQVVEARGRQEAS